MVRYGLLALNVLILGAVVVFVAHSYHASTSAGEAVKSAAASDTDVANPLDQVSSADIAVNIARATNLPESTAVTNEADSQNAQLAVVQSSDSLIAKPQVVATAFKSNKDIQEYIAKKGDTVASIAAKFHVTSDSIRWSNDLQGNDVTPGQKLLIPPVNGIVYVVKSGDTAAILAERYHTSKSKIVAYNDAEISGLRVGERIIIPGGQKVSGNISSVGSGGTNISSGAFPWGAGPVYGYNGYDYGYCTWYVASQISVPSNWGNAATWAYYASASGWNVSSSPAPGSIAQTPYAAGGLGHVAIVDAVSSDGSMVKITDMNGLAGFGQVGTGWEPASKYQNYITH